MGKTVKTKIKPGVGRLPYPAYHGDEPYIFISYAHKDSKRVFAEIARFNQAGYHVWYDEGIAPGNEWTKEIVEALERCSLFVVMLTPNSADRRNVQNEINFALSHRIPFVAVYLKKTKLPSEMQLQIGSLPSVRKYRMNQQSYENAYRDAFEAQGLKRIETDSASDHHPHIKKRKKALWIASAALIAAAAVCGAVMLFSHSPDTSVEEPSAFTMESRQPTPRASFEIDEREDVLVKYIGEETDVVIPADVNEIGEYAFSDTTVESVWIPEGVTSIKDGAFSNCIHLKTVMISNSVGWIGTSAFEDCPSLTEVKMGDGVTRMGVWVFRNDSALENVRLSENLKDLDSTFEHCSALKEMEIPASVEEIVEPFAYSGINKLLVHRDSYALEYAEQNRIPYDIID